MVSPTAILRSGNVTTAKQLYKYLMRECNKLPKDAAPYYKHTVRQSFVQHVDETDQDRVRQIIERALEDSQWIMKKYSASPKTR